MNDKKQNGEPTAKLVFKGTGLKKIYRVSDPEVHSLRVFNPYFGQTAETIIVAKTGLDTLVAFTRGILCSILVYLTAFMCFATRTAIGKVAVTMPKDAAFVALSFEHSSANIDFIPSGMLHRDGVIDRLAFAANLAPGTAGKIVGGGGLLTLVCMWRGPAGCNEQSPSG